MRYSLSSVLIVTAFFIVSGIFPLFEKPSLCAGDVAIEEQVAGILVEESAAKKIKVAILDFTVSPVNSEKKLSENESKDLGARYTEELIAGVMRKIKESGKRENVAIIDQSKLDDILREKNVPAKDATVRTITELGRMAGVDVIITGRIQAVGNSVTATAKVVRVRDGEILSIAKQDRQEKPARVAQAPITILNTVEKIKIGSSKAVPLNLTSGGTLTVAVDVVHGNPIDITVIPGQEFENFKERKEFTDVALFTAAKMKTYRRSANLKSGDYYLVLRDSSLGIFSVQDSEIKITVQLEP